MLTRWMRAIAAFALVAAGVTCGGAGSPAAPTPTLQSSPSSQFSEAAFREAARITAAAQIAVLNDVGPGLFERDVKTVVDTVFQQQGGGAPAFTHIVAAGVNALDLHYAGGDRQMADGDLLVVDIGATSDLHCADVTRTYPVAGHFSARQLELWQLVFEAQRQVETRARPGMDSIQSLDTMVREFLQESPLRARDANGAELTLDQFFIHSIGHYVGREIHGGDTGWSTKAPLERGQVVAIEPGLYITSEGIGIRIEDTYLVTATGLECLSCSSPKQK